MKNLPETTKKVLPKTDFYYKIFGKAIEEEIDANFRKINLSLNSMSH